MNEIFRTRPGRKRKTKQGDKCLVCGDSAIGLNFGVQTCSPCKAFFRRNAVKLGTIEFQCRDDGDCPVTSDTRRQCNCCRLAKCFRVGMDRKAIRTDDQRRERLLLIESNRQKRSEHNIINKSLAIPNKPLIRPTNLLLQSKEDVYLSADSYDLLTNIFHGYNKTCTSTPKEQLTMPVNESLTVRAFLNASSSIYISFISFLQLLPEFRSIPIDGKFSLVKSNFKHVLFKHCAYLIHTVTPDLHQDSPVCLHLFPKEVYASFCERSFALTPFVHDPILMKLSLIILTFSTYLSVSYECQPTTHTKTNITKTILQAQNIYVELLWRYILTRCSNFQKSVHLITSLISRVLHSQKSQIMTEDFIRTSVVQQQEQELAPIIQSIWIPDAR
ncbi:unnamed protein product [Adineta ricciae]|uniref:Nuclear receptor domain-containing protein n=1 Tax=Adineta ricciae TaxID=249248 RepID=A0A815IFU1_ADIRI|nr:unnamed protein product [Adineta ricciae]